MKIIDRLHDRETITKWIKMFPVLAILGPRQCGKTTLARTMRADYYFDLENPQDAARLDQPQLALEDLKEVAEELADVAIVEQAPSMEGKVMTMVLSSSKPVPHKKPAAPAASGKPEAAGETAGKSSQPAEH